MSRERGVDRAAVAAEVESLYAQHGTTVLALCRTLLRDRAEAEDAAQQTFLSAQRALANGSKPREPAPWLATIARNECYARLRARASRPVPTAVESDDVSPDAHATAVRREQVAELRDALAGLPAQQREALLLREVRGLSYDEVAVSLAVTTSAVESLLFRARRRLQLSLREAAAAVSPEGLLAPLRDLAARLAGGGLAIPGLAKVVAVGVGTVAVAGGGDVSTQLLRHGRHPVFVPPHAARIAPQHRAPAPAAAVAPVAASSPVTVAPAAFAKPAVTSEHERSSEHPAAAEREREHPQTAQHESEQSQSSQQESEQEQAASATSEGGDSSGTTQEQSDAAGAPLVFQPVSAPEQQPSPSGADQADEAQLPQAGGD